MDKDIQNQNQPSPTVAGQVEFGVRPDVPEVNFGDMPMGAVYTPSLGSVGAAMYTYTAGQVIQYAAKKAREARDAERERGNDARRWISTHAHRIEALEGLLRAAQIEAHAGREAVASLTSERAANAMLTDEVERLRAHAVTLAETARQVEQERCAMICEALTSRSSEYDAATMDCAAAIRGPNVEVTG